MEHEHPLMIRGTKSSKIVNTKATPLRRTDRVPENSDAINGSDENDSSQEAKNEGFANEFQFTNSKRHQKFPQYFYSNSRSEKYEILKRLGDGGFSVCFLFRMPDRSISAGKIFSRGRTCARKRLERFEREVNLMKHFNHPNIVHFIEAASGVYRGKVLADFAPEDKIQFVQPPVMFLEYCAGGSLSGFLKNRLDKRRFPYYHYGQLTQSETLWVAECASRALAYIHEKRFIHRDIKLGNLLLQTACSNKDNIAHSRIGIVICDFGLAVYLPESEVSIKGRAGTPSYMPRELVRGQGATFASDIWSLGVTLFHCLTGRAPFDAEDTSGIYRRIKENVYRWKTIEKENISPDLRALVDQMMYPDPKKRPTAAEVLKRVKEMQE